MKRGGSCASYYFSQDAGSRQDGSEKPTELDRLQVDKVEVSFFSLTLEVTDEMVRVLRLWLVVLLERCYKCFR